jgi:uncharacterized protein YcbK (DUF882 family)
MIRPWMRRCASAHANIETATRPLQTSMSHPPCGHRRRFMRRAAGLSALTAASIALPMAAAPARAAGAERRLSFVHLHTGERLAVVFRPEDAPAPEAQRQLDRFLRDHYSGEVGRMDPRLFTLLDRVQRELGQAGDFEVISGFRGHATNERLRLAGGGGVARQSLHLEGRALDLRLAGVPLVDLRDAAYTLRGGGVGFYGREQFVHLDTGRIRSW